MNFLEKNALEALKTTYMLKNETLNPSNIVIPNVGTTDENGAKTVKDIFSTLHDARIIMCDGEVNDTMASVVVGQLLHLSYEDEKAPIHMYINSPGGSITAGRAIFDAMLYIKCPVITIGLGMCASMGSFLLAAGNLTGGAKILPGTEVMIHQPLGGFQGQATDFDIHAKRIMKMKKELTAQLAYFAAQNKDSIIGRMEKVEDRLARLAEDCERDNYMSAEEALEYGLVSEIIQSKKMKKSLLDSMREEGYLD